MTVDDAFNEFQKVVNADPTLVQEAKDRRNKFADALTEQDDVQGALFIGSIARASQIEPIKDVDLVIFYSRDAHPGWGSPGTSADEAQERAQEQVNALLGAEGTVEPGFVRLTRKGNHALRCFLDDPDDPDAFTVDVVPALENEDRTIDLTERDNSQWIRSHPRRLNEEVAARHSDWPYFVPLVRLLKRWSRDHGDTMLPLLLEVLAIDLLIGASRSTALAAFFTSAATRIDEPVYDPAGISLVQPDLNVPAARDRLEKAADLAWRATSAESSGDTERAICLWREVFGNDFPEPPRGCGSAIAAVAGLAGLGAARPRDHRRPAKEAPQG